ncbi:MAG TPA: hypothetical protein VIM98_06275 [Dyella sp.]|uniref:hypothetical protein n=1 Tax=Dyella sp. TaxID=1869338 RepID=UPI002F947533
MFMFRHGVLGAALLCLVLSTAHAAGGSYLVDDASTTPAGRCQLESWLQVFRDGRLSLTATPACAVGNLEFSLGLTHQNIAHGNGQNPALKWRVRDGGIDGTSIALDFNSSVVGGKYTASNAYAAFSRLLDSAGRWTANLDLGVEAPRGVHRRATAGLGLEYAPAPELSLLAEHTRTAGQGSVTQGGVRWHIGANSVDLIAGASHERTTSRWITVGLNLAF